MPYLELKGKKINYNETGSRKNPAIILLHNGFYSTITWDNIRNELANDFLVIDYDRYGYGKSSPIDQIEGDIVKAGVEELELLVKKLNLKEFYLCGHCLGGAIALLYTIAHPKKVKKIIAESVGYYSDIKLSIKSNWTFQTFENTPEKLQNKLKTMHGDEYAKDFWEILRNYKDGYIMNDDYNILNDIKKIKCPIFIINGDRDFYFAPDHPVSAYEKIKIGRLWIAPDTGHDLHVEQKDDFIKNITKFIKE